MFPGHLRQFGLIPHQGKRFFSYPRYADVSDSLSLLLNGLLEAASLGAKWPGHEADYSLFLVLFIVLVFFYPN
jgi:hypothetical protein